MNTRLEDRPSAYYRTVLYYYPDHLRTHWIGVVCECRCGPNENIIANHCERGNVNRPLNSGIVAYFDLVIDVRKRTYHDIITYFSFVSNVGKVPYLDILPDLRTLVNIVCDARSWGIVVVTAAHCFTDATDFLAL